MVPLERFSKVRKRDWGTRDKKKYRDHSTAKICWNIGKSPGDLERLTVTQAPVKKFEYKTRVKFHRE